MIENIRKFIIVLILLNIIYSQNPFDEDILKGATSIVPLVDKNNNLFIISGKDLKNENYKYPIKIYNISNYNNIDVKTFETPKRFEDSEVIFAGDDLQYFLINLKQTLFFYDGENLKEITQTPDDFEQSLKGTFKKFNNSYIYISSEGNLTKFDINFNDTANPVIESIDSKKQLNDSRYLSSISCDATENEEFFVCSYYIRNKTYGISVFSNKLEFLYEKNFEKNTILEPKDFFNEIIYLKNNKTFISIYSVNDTFVNLRFFDINEKDYNNLLLEKNISKREYLEINGSQLNPYYYNSDIASINKDTIIKLYADNKIYIMTKIQLYENDTILTIKHFNFPFSSELPVINPHLAIWRNCFILASAYHNNSDTSTEYSTRFYIHGYPYLPKDALNNLNITDNHNIKMSKFELKNELLFSKLFVYYKILDIPDGFVFIDSLDSNEINEGEYLTLEKSELAFKQYKRNTKAKFIYQGITISDLLYEKETFKIFSNFSNNLNNSNISETKIIGEGDKVTINIEINSCNNGFYEVEDKDDICTKIRPSGYYLDKANNMFKKCHPKCSECLEFSDDDLNMKCLKCILNHKYNNNTFNCRYDDDNLQPYTTNFKPEESQFSSIFVAIFIIAVILIFLVIFGNQILICIQKRKNKNNVEELLKENEKEENVVNELVENDNKSN
jgi:hypothetical protein